MKSPLEARLESISLSARSFAHDLGNLMLPGVSGFTDLAQSTQIDSRQRRLCAMAEAVFFEMAALRDAFEVVIDRPREAPCDGENLATWWRASAKVIRPLIGGRPAIRSEFPQDLPRVGVPGPLIGRALLAVLLDAADQALLADELSLIARADASAVRLEISGIRGGGAAVTEGGSIAAAAVGQFGGACEATAAGVALILPRHAA